MEYETLLAKRTERIGTNAIREILKVVSRPGMVSMAGGIPSPESFPLGILRKLTRIVFDKYGSRAFQYDMTEGFPPLRKALSDYLTARRKIPAAAGDLLVTSGSQGVLDAVGKILISPGDRVAVEAPTYIGALQAFGPYAPDYVQIDTDAEGVVPASLERAVRDGGARLIYLVPTFQNPSGRTVPLYRRIEIAEILKRYDALLIEDDPYSLLRYRGEDIPPIRTFAPGHVIYVSTLSKVLAPGLRVGFCLAPEPIRGWLVRVKQGVDLHTSTFNQALAAEYLARGYLDRHLPNILRQYGPRLAAILAALEAHFPEGFRWSLPDGGMFVWVEGPSGLDIEEIYWRAIEKNVAFVPGRFFFAHEGEGMDTLRLNFTMADEATLDRSIKVLAGVMKSRMGCGYST